MSWTNIVHYLLGSSPLNAKHLGGLALHTPFGRLVFQVNGLLAFDVQAQHLVLQALSIPGPRHVHIHHAHPGRALDIEMHSEMRGAEPVDFIAVGQRAGARPLVRRRLAVRLDLA